MGLRAPQNHGEECLSPENGPGRVIQSYKSQKEKIPDALEPAQGPHSRVMPHSKTAWVWVLLTQQRGVRRNNTYL